MVKIIAELCQNHKGDIGTLKKMVWEAAENGATYAKIQTIFADDLTRRERFEEGTIEGDVVKAIKRPYESEYARLKPMDLDRKAHEIFLKECQAAGIRPLTTIFARARIPFVQELGFKEVKVASYDCASFPMIHELKERFKHLYISTGATYDNEIEKTTRILSGHSFSFLHCITIYPTPLNQLNLARMEYLRKFAKEVGFSDHTLFERDGLKASIAAIYYGAQVIERHFTILDKTITKDGPVSINPTQLKELVETSKMSRGELEGYTRKNLPEFEQMIGLTSRTLSHEELLNRDYYRGRFASKVNGQIIYNWEDRTVF
ncbi:MAG: general stress protein [Thaumarchaeota archaeon]|nr:general stress protein [Nitrososphaerota archaeon]